MKKPDENGKKNGEKWQKYTCGDFHGPCHDQASVEPAKEEKRSLKMESKACGDRHMPHGVHHEHQKGPKKLFALVATAMSFSS